MPIVEWSESSSVGVKQLDEQHRAIFRLMGDLHEAVLHGQPDVQLRSILTSLIEVFDVHFAAEEDVMKQAGYPGLPAHAAEHAAFRERVVGLVEDHKAGDSIVTGSLLLLMKTWIDDHVHGSDQRYAWYLRRPT